MENKKITNDENISNLKKRKILRYLIITFSLITMGFAIADLFLQQTLLLILAIICLIITTALNKYRDSLTIIKKDELKEIREAIAENDKKFKKGVIIEDPMDEEPKKEEKKEEVKEEVKEVVKKTTPKKTTTKKSTTTKKKTSTGTKKTTSTAKKSTSSKSTTTKKKKATTKKATAKKTTSTKKKTTTKKNTNRTKKTVDKA